MGLAFGFYGTSQIQVQRFLSMGGCKKAQSTLKWSSIPIVVLLCLASSFGLVLYSVFTCAILSWMNQNQVLQDMTKSNAHQPLYMADLQSLVESRLEPATRQLHTRP
ncbi:hypothetical protein TNCV_2738941 [Trichonephila clavipes]|nr:hypothetical protein TNCV_2738941 [Trichonephila clavipes]